MGMLPLTRRNRAAARCVPAAAEHMTISPSRQKNESLIDAPGGGEHRLDRGRSRERLGEHVGQALTRKRWSVTLRRLPIRQR